MIWLILALWPLSWAFMWSHGNFDVKFKIEDWFSWFLAIIFAPLLAFFGVFVRLVFGYSLTTGEKRGKR